jgi:GNAT superfamily N-acetyltransferase
MFIADEFAIRFADVSDAALVREIALEAFGEYADTLVPPPGILRESVEDVAESIAAGGAILAFDRTNAVGSARFRPESTYLYIGRVAVRPPHRRLGIAGQMMAFLEAHAIELGLSEARV